MFDLFVISLCLTTPAALTRLAPPPPSQRVSTYTGLGADAVQVYFDSLSDLTIDACPSVSDEGMVAVLSSFGGALRALRLRRFGATQCGRRPMRALVEALKLRCLFGVGVW